MAFLELERICQEGSFVEFAGKCLGITLTPAQRAVAGFLFDGCEPAPEYSNVVFGGQSTEPPSNSRGTALVLCGRGSGKSRAFIAGRAIHLALTADLSPLARGEVGLVALVAPTQQHGRHSLNFVKGYFLENPVLAKILQIENTQDVVRITRLDGRQVTIEVRAASGGGKSVRGPSLAGVLLDEAAFFYGEGYEVSDTEIYRAAVPRMLPKSQIVLATTPWAQSGLVWELFRENFGKATTAVVAKAPTLVMRPDVEELRVAYQNALRDDPDNAVREYDAQFLSADADRFFPEAVIERAIDEALVIPGEVQLGEKVRFGADFAFASDSSALFGFVDRGDLHIAVSLEELRPKPGLPLVPSEVVESFAREIQRGGAKLVIADDHYREAIQEHLSDYQLSLVPAPKPPAAAFIVARTLMAQGRVRIPNHSRLLSQLRRVRATQKPGGVVTIHQPRVKEGGHGDIVSALVCALSGCSTEANHPLAAPKNRLEALTIQEKVAQTDRLRQNEARLNKAAKRMIQLTRQRLGRSFWKEMMK